MLQFYYLSSDLNASQEVKCRTSSNTNRVVIVRGEGRRGAGENWINESQINSEHVLEVTYLPGGEQTSAETPAPGATSTFF